MKRTLPLILPALAFAAILSSCYKPRVYELQMASRGDVLERTLTADVSGDANLPDSEAAAFARLYSSHRAEPNGGPHVFAGTFRGRTPNDIGGAGFHAFLPSTLGGTTIYIERFRGNDDLLEQIETRLKAADRVVDLLAGWLKAEAGKEKDFDKLQAFLDKDLRRDLKNLSLYLWIGDNDLFRLETPGGSGLMRGLADVFADPNARPAPQTQPETSVSVYYPSGTTLEIAPEADTLRARALSKVRMMTLDPNLNSFRPYFDGDESVRTNRPGGAAAAGGGVNVASAPSPAARATTRPVGGAARLTLLLDANGVVPGALATMPFQADARPATTTPEHAEDGQPAEPSVEALVQKGREELIARIFQYLMEKGYFQPKDASLFAHVTDGTVEEQMHGAAALVERVLTIKAGITDRSLLARVTAFARSPEDANTMGASLAAYLKNTPQYQSRLADWKAAAKRDPNSKDWIQPDPVKVLTDAFGELEAGLEGFLGPTDTDALAIRLACPVEPVWTNGEWTRESHAIVWRRAIRTSSNDSRRMSTLCYAVWAEPDVAFQPKHFGGVVLTGLALLDYCMWRGGLSATEAAEWDAMVASLAPNPQLIEKVRAFRFSGRPARPPQPAPSETQPPEPPQDYLQHGKDLILRAVRGSPATQPATTPAAGGGTDANAVQTLVWRVTSAKDEHLGHNIMPDTHVHTVWIDGRRGRLAESNEEFVVYWNGAKPPFPFEQGNAYTLRYRGPLGTGVLGYQGKCLDAANLVKAEPAKN